MATQDAGIVIQAPAAGAGRPAGGGLLPGVHCRKQQRLSEPSVRLAWLIKLRWIAVLGQLAVLLGATWLHGAPGPLGGIFALVAATAATNLGLSLWLPREERGARAAVVAALILDTLILTGLLHLSGGAANPFSVFYLVHVALAALLLEPRGAWLLAVISSVCFASLFFWKETDPHAHHGSDFAAHLQGMWVSYTLAAVFVGAFVSRMARSLEERERELARLERIAARGEKLASLSTLAAGAAHELGSPLGTIAIVSRELERAAAAGALDAAFVGEEARLLREEAERCKGILSRMAARAGQSQGELPQRLGTEQVLAGLRGELGEEAAGRVSFEAPGAALAVEAPANALTQVLVNLVRNALDASPEEERVEVEVAGDQGWIHFRVRDRGPGIPREHLERLGEPFFTTKEPGKGMGLGLFLVRSFADRWGGRLEVEGAPGGGSRFTLSLPRR